MKTIKFSSDYVKLGGVVNDYDTAFLMEVFEKDLKDMSGYFLDYDTWKRPSTKGQYELKPNKYLVLLFDGRASQDGSGSSHVFTTIRRSTPSKKEYYLDSRGEPFRVLIEAKDNG